MRELAREAERRAEQVGLDAERLAEMERRLDLVLGLKKKYGGSVEAALSRLEDLKKRQAELADASGIEQKLEEDIRVAAHQHRQACAKLSEGRKKAAPRFTKEVTEQLRGLGFAQSRLEAERRAEQVGLDAERLAGDEVEAPVDGGGGCGSLPLHRGRDGGAAVAEGDEDRLPSDEADGDGGDERGSADV